jgi:hypothetical protein
MISKVTMEQVIITHVSITHVISPHAISHHALTLALPAVSRRRTGRNPDRIVDTLRKTRYRKRTE